MCAIGKCCIFNEGEDYEEMFQVGWMCDGAVSDDGNDE
jgi:hypothetical protein